MFVFRGKQQNCLGSILAHAKRDAFLWRGRKGGGGDLTHHARSITSTGENMPHEQVTPFPLTGTATTIAYAPVRLGQLHSVALGQGRHSRSSRCTQRGRRPSSALIRQGACKRRSYARTAALGGPAASRATNAPTSRRSSRCFSSSLARGCAFIHSATLWIVSAFGGSRKEAQSWNARSCKTYPVASCFIFLSPSPASQSMRSQSDLRATGSSALCRVPLHVKHCLAILLVSTSNAKIMFM